MKKGKGKRKAKNWRERQIVYRTWKNMLLRCYNPDHVSYGNYGGRGIRVWTRWHPAFNPTAFDAFHHYIGHRPSSEHSLDRINPNGHYVPGNIRWATWEEQNNNKRVHASGLPKEEQAYELAYEGNPETAGFAEGEELPTSSDSG